jgi:hypothetical protein
MAATSLFLGAALAYLFGAFMARPLDAMSIAAANIGQGKPVEALSSPLHEANAVTQAMERGGNGAAAASGARPISDA